jgi:hypothetical protein
MSGENVSERLPKTAEERTTAQKSISHLLTTIPDRWKDYDSGGFTESEEQALFLLTAAGMVERCCCLTSRLRNQRSSIEAEISFTGVKGGIEALELLYAELWKEWAEDWRAWKTGDTKDIPALHCEALSPSRWRLTKEGVQARKELRDGNFGYVYSYVLKTEPFKHRHPVRGHGRLLKVIRPEPSKTTEVDLLGVAIQKLDADVAKLAASTSENFNTVFEKFEQQEQAANGRRKKAAKKKAARVPDPKQQERDQFEARFYLLYEKFGLREACRECDLDEAKGTRLRNKLRMRKRRVADKAEKNRPATKPREG